MNPTRGILPAEGSSSSSSSSSFSSGGSRPAPPLPPPARPPEGAEDDLNLEDLAYGLDGTIKLKLVKRLNATR